MTTKTIKLNPNDNTMQRIIRDRPYYADLVFTVDLLLKFSPKAIVAMFMGHMPPPVGAIRAHKAA